jgi:hypothetical protein
VRVTYDAMASSLASTASPHPERSALDLLLGLKDLIALAEHEHPE